jgi:hypothetical protein
MKDYKVETIVILKFTALQSSKNPTALKSISNELAIEAIRDATKKSPLFKAWLSKFVHLETTIKEIDQNEKR